MNERTHSCACGEVNLTKLAALQSERDRIRRQLDDAWALLTHIEMVLDMDRNNPEELAARIEANQKAAEGVSDILDEELKQAKLERDKARKAAGRWRRLVDKIDRAIEEADREAD